MHLSPVWFRSGICKLFLPNHLYLGFVGCKVSVVTTHLCPCSVKQPKAAVDRKKLNERGDVPTELYLWKLHFLQLKF